MRRNPAIPGLVLLAGGAVTVLIGLQRMDLAEVVLAIGVTFVLAWAVERGNRFGAGGATLAGLGAGLLIAAHVRGYSSYREELAFGGIALGLLLATRLVPSGLRGAGLGLLAVALSEAALLRLPQSISAPSVYRAFNEGWGFGVAVMVYGVVTLIRGQSGRRW